MTVAGSRVGAAPAAPALRLQAARVAFLEVRGRVERLLVEYQRRPYLVQVRRRDGSRRLGRNPNAVRAWNAYRDAVTLLHLARAHVRELVRQERASRG